MSASLGSVIYQAGFDITTKEGATWLLAQRNELAEMLEQAEETLQEGGQTNDNRA